MVIPSDFTQTPSAILHPDSLAAMGLNQAEVGIVIVDHGSRRDESNALLSEVVRRFRERTRLAIVEHAHMELAEPSIAVAVERTVKQGAKLVIGNPYFLSPGRHWQADIPALFAEAVRPFPDVRYLVTAPLGLHPLMLQVMQDRVLHCLGQALIGGGRCDVCEHEANGCQFQTAGIATK